MVVSQADLCMGSVTARMTSSLVTPDIRDSKQVIASWPSGEDMAQNRSFSLCERHSTVTEEPTRLPSSVAASSPRQRRLMASSSASRASVMWPPPAASEVLLETRPGLDGAAAAPTSAAAAGEGAHEEAESEAKVGTAVATAAAVAAAGADQQAEA
eukprot:CAMPEP_0177344010 /NCGR_PEP_ID=MMETSP0368-20130122/27888_1 /TAXON_ID=447022 ORGANISM="Scrippsiella hangoei-like, Strain SHHI-4" /NCGR_SAMPLE_ID=MMETSP0368 /ASSEMBLY_ACC=CAM_ASM_000363 /LENGTH=155 /DNA_ID=CAMNT_0018805495 /DNA_START=614 /DNA_END=1078 /DNA_ORIENTATION=-